MRREGYVPCKVIDGGHGIFKGSIGIFSSVVQLPGLCQSCCSACSIPGAASSGQGELVEFSYKPCVAPRPAGLREISKVYYKEMSDTTERLEYINSLARDRYPVYAAFRGEGNQARQVPFFGLN